MRIIIQPVTDMMDCETCGSSYAEGALITIGDHVIDLTPSAHCYDGIDYSDLDQMKAILSYLGHELEVLPTQESGYADEGYDDEYSDEWAGAEDDYLE